MVKTNHWLLCVLFLAVPFMVLAQDDSLPKQPVTTDTTPVRDTQRKPAVKIERPVTIPDSDEVLPLPPNPFADSFSRKPVKKDTSWKTKDVEALMREIMKVHPYFGFDSPAEVAPVKVRRKDGREVYFYVLVGLLLFFAFLKSAFSKYFNNLFRLFFRTTLKYRQIREQLMQTPLPSLLLNVFFVVCGSLYIGFLLLHFELIVEDDYWLYVFYSCIGLSVIYFVKFLGLKVIGWIFNLREAADSYIFIVFVINKVIGVFLLPFVVMLAFMTGMGYQVALILSWFGLAGLILYRYILAYAAVRNKVRFNLFHFLLYLIAFEIAPLLLIYKALLILFD
jgi:hypothetical protein